jgi:hypothetical protein
LWDTRFRYPEAIPAPANAPRLPGLSIRCRAPPRAFLNPDERTRYLACDARFAIRTFLKKACQRSKGNLMTKRLQYGTTAKVFHWLIVALLLVQYSIGWLMRIFMAA